MDGYLLMNIGTPSEPTIKGVRKYLKEFLSDPDVIDTNRFLRWAIVNLIVTPLRPRRVLPQYKSIWMDEGSPLLVHSQNFAGELKVFLGTSLVEVGMRYGAPSIADGIDKLASAGATRIILCPMFPQYAQATTGSCIKKAQEEVLSRGLDYGSISDFYNEEFYIDCLVDKIRDSAAYQNAEVLLFSFHGLPERQVKRLDQSGEYCIFNPLCCDKKSEYNEKCYRFHCSETVRLIMAKLGNAKPHKICFQSRFGLDRWIQPDILDTLRDFTDKGITKVAVSCPSFTADCLETLEEISIRDFEFYESVGGHSLDLVPSLNSTPEWVEGFAKFLSTRN
jgi:ferrochelatase